MVVVFFIDEYLNQDNMAIWKDYALPVDLRLSEQCWLVP
jgi:hypothetical protein